MKRPKRVDCQNCEYFLNPGFADELDLFSKMTNPPRSELCKRVMFRNPKISTSHMAQDWGGWFRYCNDYSNLSYVTSNI